MATSLLLHDLAMAGTCQSIVSSMNIHFELSDLVMINRKCICACDSTNESPGPNFVDY
jgi:hypothetical protein